MCQMKQKPFPLICQAFSGVAVDRAYIGLTDFEEEGTFKWVGNITTSYDNWASG